MWSLMAQTLNWTWSRTRERLRNESYDSVTHVAKHPDRQSNRRLSRAEWGALRRLAAQNRGFGAAKPVWSGLFREILRSRFGNVPTNWDEAVSQFRGLPNFPLELAQKMQEGA